MANILQIRDHIVQDLLQSPAETRIMKLLALSATYPAAILFIKVQGCLRKAGGGRPFLG